MNVLFLELIYEASLVKPTVQKCYEIMNRSSQLLFMNVPNTFCQDGYHSQQVDKVAKAHILEVLGIDSNKIIHQLRLGH